MNAQELTPPGTPSYGARVPTKRAREIPDATGPSLEDLIPGSLKPWQIAAAGGPAESHMLKVRKGLARVGEGKLAGLAKALELDVEVVRMAYSVSVQRADAAKETVK